MKSLFATLSLLIGLTITGCTSDDEALQRVCKTDKVKGASGDIVGDWKLVKRDRLFGPSVEIDHSCDNIVLSFKKDSTYTVSSNIPSFLGSGEDTLEYRLESIDQSQTIFKITADKAEWQCTISEYEMIWDNTMLDSGRMIFNRIK